MNTGLIAKNLLIGNGCNDCIHRQLVDGEDWKKDIYICSEYKCCSPLRQLGAGYEVTVYPEWLDVNGIEFDDKGICEYWNKK